MPNPPLAGIIVVALEQAVAVPFATRQLADLGARVIKIERPISGDFARAYDTTVRGLSSHFVWLNRGKESLTLDLKQPIALLAVLDSYGSCSGRKRRDAAGLQPTNLRLAPRICGPCFSTGPGPWACSGAQMN